MRQRGLKAPALEKLANHPDRIFDDEVVWLAQLRSLDIAPMMNSPATPPGSPARGLWGASTTARSCATPLFLNDEAGAP